MRTAGHISKDVLQAPGFMSLVYWPEFNTRNENLGILGTKRSAANVLLQNMTPEAGKTALGKTLGNNSRWEQKCRGGQRRYGVLGSNPRTWCGQGRGGGTYLAHLWGFLAPFPTSFSLALSPNSGLIPAAALQLLSPPPTHLDFLQPNSGTTQCHVFSHRF